MLVTNPCESTFCQSSEPISPKRLTVGLCSQRIWMLSTETEFLKGSNSPNVFQGELVSLKMLQEPLGEEKWGKGNL